jgi:Tfp pilus assembly protein PilV
MLPANASGSAGRSRHGVGGCSRHGAGETLLEVLLATWLVAIAALGTVGAQLWMVRAQQASASRSIAVSLADSVAEALRSEMDPAQVRALFEQRAAGSLPGGRIAVLSSGDKRHLITVSWTAGTPGKWAAPGAAAVLKPGSRACAGAAEALEECLQIEVGQ